MRSMQYLVTISSSPIGSLLWLTARLSPGWRSLRNSGWQLAQIRSEAHFGVCPICGRQDPPFEVVLIWAAEGEGWWRLSGP